MASIRRKTLSSCSANIVDRFNSRFIPEPNTGCWLWLGTLCRGYASISVGPAGFGAMSAHVVSYELHIGEIKNGDVISHRCGNRLCVNPDHLVARRRQPIFSQSDGGTGSWWPVSGTAPPMTAARLRELIDYNPTEGEFRWRVTRANNARAGEKIGRAPEPLGRVTVQIERRLYRLHRLAWLYVHGEWPTGFVDHIDRNPGNNRIANLRLATPAQNSWNRGKMKRNTTGFKGVVRADRGRWGARIMANGKQRWLGVFDTAQLAHEAYVAAANRLHGEFARRDASK